MKPTIIFFGTHEFAAHIVTSLLASKAVTVAAVVTQPDKPAGRGGKLEEPPIKKILAHEGHNIPMLQPATLKGPGIAHQLTTYHADLFIVCEYGKLIPESVLDIPQHKTLNVHPSLLPLYRGPSPIQQALVDGASQTGTSIMLLDKDMDHGPILAQEKIAVDPGDTFSTLRTKLADVSAKLLAKTLPGYIDGTVKPKEQDHSKATFTKLFEREDGRIDWSQPADKIYNLYRGLTPWPGVFTEIKKDGKPLRLKLLAIKPTERPSKPHAPGAFITEKNSIFVATGTTLIELQELQLEGKKSLTSAQFINGFGHYLTA